MTWHHVAALLIAATLVALCILTRECTTSLPMVISFALAIAAGTFGHAGQQRKQAEGTHTKGTDNEAKTLGKEHP